MPGLSSQRAAPPRGPMTTWATTANESGNTASLAASRRAWRSHCWGCDIYKNWSLTAMTNFNHSKISGLVELDIAEMTSVEGGAGLVEAFAAVGQWARDL